MNALVRRFAVGGLVCWGTVSGAQPVPTPPSQTTEEQALTPEAQAIWKQDYLTGDWGGTRTVLADRYGVVPHLIYTGEVFGNLSGGLRRGAAYEGLADFGITIDLEKLTGGAWPGATFFANAYEIHGRSMTDKYTGDLLVVSNIDALDTIRLFELWLEQSFADGRVSLRVGQLAADSEFAISDYGALFLDGTFGWPEGIAANAPTPAYAVAGLGVRLAVQPTENTSLMAGFFDGNPDPVDANGNPLNDHGVYWNLGEEGMFAIFEAAYHLNPSADADPADPKACPIHEGLPGTYKLGGWFHTGDFPNNEFDVDGVFLGSMLSTGDPRIENGNWGIYAIANQMVWREQPGSNDQGLALFARVAYSPAEQAFFNVYTDFGCTYCGLIPGRDADTCGIAFAYGSISDGIGDVQEALGLPAQRDTAVLEVTYQVVLTPWWTLQPDFQYIFQPDGASESDGGLPNAVVVGLRTQLAF